MMPAVQTAKERQGLSPELVAKLKAIQIRTRHLVTDALAGDYESAFKGRGMEFEEVREYSPGDDIRHIDWKVTAKMRAPYVKEHREERELTVMLMVDLSPSGTFGSKDKLKNEIAAEVAALLAYAAIKSNDRVGLIIFSNRIEHFIPPKKGRAHVWRVIRDILAFEPEGKGTDLPAALRYLGKVVRRRSVTFLISDFLDQRLSDELRIVAQKHDLTAISIADPRESAMPNIGLITLEDAETGEQITIDTSQNYFDRDLAKLARRETVRHRDFFRSANIGEVKIHTHASIVDPIVRYFRSKDARY